MNTSSPTPAKNKAAPKSASKKKRFSFFRMLLVSSLALFVLGCASALAIVFYTIKDAKPINAATIQSMLEQSSFIYDNQGKLVQKIHGDTFRTLVPLSKIPLDLQNAVIAIEDERFYEHHGIDYKRVAGAIWHDLKTMSLEQGASTLTMQLSKNLYTSPSRDITRKIQDAYYALEIEKQINDKNQILQAYLNTMDMGRRAYGVQAGAQMYFSKDVSELNLAECAILAGITRWPSNYTLFKSALIDPADDRKSLEVLLLPATKETTLTPEDKQLFKQLLEMGKINRYDYSALMRGELNVRKAVFNEKSKKRQEVVLTKMLELGKINQEQYKQALASPIVIKPGKMSTEKISTYFFDKLQKDIVEAFVKKGYSEEEATKMYLSGGLRIHSTMDSAMQAVVESEFANSQNFPGSSKDGNNTLQPQGAMVIQDQMTGEVKAIIGGRGIGGSKIFNRALNPRQPGSAIKPLAVYMPALMRNLTAASLFEDTPRPDGKGGQWPTNVGRYRGSQTIRQLLQYSSNVGTVRVAETLGETPKQSIQVMIDFLKQLGFSTVVTQQDNPKNNDEGLALTLGGMSEGLIPMEVNAAYAALANSGKFTTPLFFTRVENAAGDILLENKPNFRQLMDPDLCTIMTDMLKTVVEEGNGQAARLSSMPAAGKTGTTTKKKDAWFVGYTPYLTATLWIGTDTPAPLSEGSAMAARIWKKVMDRVSKDMPVKEFSRTPGVVEVWIDPHTGQAVPAGTAGARIELFKQGTEPPVLAAPSPPVVEPPEQAPSQEEPAPAPDQEDPGTQDEEPQEPVSTPAEPSPGEVSPSNPQEQPQPASPPETNPPSPMKPPKPSKPTKPIKPPSAEPPVILPQDPAPEEVPLITEIDPSA